MNTEVVKIKDITEASYNPRVKLKKGDKEYEALSNSLKRFGTVIPVVINQRTGTLISGHQRINVLKAQGKKEVEAVIVDLDEEHEKMLNIALNKIDGEWDYIKLDEVLKEIGNEDLAFTGFSAEDMGDILDVYGDGEPEEKKGSEIKEVGIKESPEKKFDIYLSFAKKNTANQWLEDKGFDERFEDGNRNILIKAGGKK